MATIMVGNVDLISMATGAIEPKSEVFQVDLEFASTVCWDWPDPLKSLQERF